MNALFAAVPGYTADWWSRIQAHYSEPHRFYHTMRHLDSMAAMYAEHAATVTTKHALVLAMAFHDVIYNPRSPTNEEDSAALFDEYASEARLPPDDAAYVHKLILDTKYHVAPPVDDPCFYDTALFLDLDMAIVGAEPAAYDEYASNIRREYIHVEAGLYCKARAAVLRTFLEKPIFTILTRLEGPARGNIAREISRLEAGAIGGMDNERQ